MSRMTKADCAELVAILAGTYHNVTFDENALSSWHFMLGPYDKDAVMAVLRPLIVANPKFCPTAADFALTMEKALHPKIDPQQAWDAVHKAIRGCGVMNPSGCSKAIRDAFPPDQADVIIAAAEAISWYRLGMTEFHHHGPMLAQFRGFIENAGTRMANEEVRERIAIPPVFLEALDDGADDEA